MHACVHTSNPKLILPFAGRTHSRTRASESSTLQRLHKDFLLWQQHQMGVSSTSQRDSDTQRTRADETQPTPWAKTIRKGDGRQGAGDRGGRSGGRDYGLRGLQDPDYSTGMELMRPHTAREVSLCTVREMGGWQGTGFVGDIRGGLGGQGSVAGVGRISNTRRALMASASRSCAKYAAGLQVQG